MQPECSALLQLHMSNKHYLVPDMGHSFLKDTSAYWKSRVAQRAHSASAHILHATPQSMKRAAGSMLGGAMPATQWLFRELYLSRMAGSSLARMH